jgi:hypothetical protein
MTEAAKSPKPAKKASPASPKKIKGKIEKPQDVVDFEALIEQHVLSLAPGKFLETKVLESIPDAYKTRILEINNLRDLGWNPLQEPPSKYGLELSTLSAIQKWSQNPILAIQLWGENSTLELLRVIAGAIKGDLAAAQKVFVATSKPSVLPKRKRNSLASELSDLIDVTSLPTATTLKFLEYLVSNDLCIKNHVLKLENLENAFNELNDDAQAKYVLAIKKSNFEDFLLFFTRLEISKVRIALLKEVRAKVTNEDILKFYEWKNPTPKFSAVGVETKIIKASIDERMKLSSVLPDLLTLWPAISNPENAYELGKFQDRIQSELSRDTSLAISLRNPEIKKLKATNSELAQAATAAKAALDASEKKRQLLSEALEEAKADVIALRNRLTEMSKGDQIGLEAKENQVRIDLLRTLLQTFQVALDGGRPEEILTLLESQNIERVGKPGSKIPWNPETCESLTGEVSDTVEIIEPGFTWFNGTQTISLKRILVRNT